ncbi:hypothetical protein [Maribacter antarcticus]|uniref:hypothetical protein n=1 Tax=Maribacter antarcticus TaxID=505250 RepID=UPI000B2599FC|nr:hypothetical protein [Maribacter antarcticus]
MAALFAKKYDVVGFDINEKRIAEIIVWKDTTLKLTNLKFGKRTKKMVWCILQVLIR